MQEKRDNRATFGGVEGGQDYAIPYITTLTRLILQSVTTSALLEGFVIIRGVFTLLVALCVTKNTAWIL